MINISQEELDAIKEIYRKNRQNIKSIKKSTILMMITAIAVWTLVTAFWMFFWSPAMILVTSVALGIPLFCIRLEYKDKINEIKLLMGVNMSNKDMKILFKNFEFEYRLVALQTKKLQQNTVATTKNNSNNTNKKYSQKQTLKICFNADKENDASKRFSAKGEHESQLLAKNNETQQKPVIQNITKKLSKSLTVIDNDTKSAANINFKKASKQNAVKSDEYTL